MAVPLQPADWRAALDDARRQGGQRILFLGLLLARELLDTPLPAPVLEAARADCFISGLASRIGITFFDSQAYFKKARAFFFLEAKMIQGLGNRVRYFWGRIATPNEEDMQAWQERTEAEKQAERKKVELESRKLNGSGL